MNFRRFIPRLVLWAAAVLSVSSCQHPPKPGLTSFLEAQRDDFFKSELSRIAPELASPQLQQNSAQSFSDSKSKLIYRSQFSVFFLDETDQTKSKERIFFVRMDGKPVNEGRAVEVTVYTGHGRFVPVEQDPRPKPVMVPGVGLFMGTPGETFKALHEKLYRQQVSPLH